MLSLKESSLHVSSRSTKVLTSLPSEILDLIFQYIYHSSGSHLSSIFPVSRTCRHLRASTYAIIFEKVTIKTNHDVIQKSSWDFLHNLLTHPHLMQYIKCLEIREALEARHLPRESSLQSAWVGQAISRKRLFECLDLMTGLRSLKFFYLSEMNLDILSHLQSATTFHISIDMSESNAPFDDVQNKRLESVLSSSPGWVCGLSLPRSIYFQQSMKPIPFLSVGKICAIDWCDNWTALEELAVQQQSLPSLQELHVSSKLLNANHILIMPGIIPWPNLKLLHVEGVREIRHLLSSVAEHLTCLEDLQLHASSTEAFHDCHDPATTQPPPSDLPFTRLRNLRHLSLRGICTHIHPKHLTTPHLRSLSLILPEYYACQNHLIEARSPLEIKWIAKNLPHLQHLELHIGSLEFLWHPTAIPGVNVRPEVYSALQAITRIPNLHTLRLFPPYVPRHGGREFGNARQPLPDEQAIRVFHHLHNQRPTLHTLSIAATFYVLRGFSPMSWLVRDGGNSKTILTTRQAGKDYELEQTWIGERRMTMKNKRHTYRKPYLTDLRGGWVFPVEDPFV